MGIPIDKLTPRLRRMMDLDSLAVNQFAQGGEQALAPDRPETPDPYAVACGEEIPLQSAIVRLCEDRGWVVFRSNPTQRTGRNLGEPDLSIYADGGRHWLVECKTAKGKLSPEQKKLREKLNKLGHMVFVIRSIEAFRAMTGIKA